MPETPHRLLRPEDLGAIRAGTDWPRLLQALGIAVDPHRSRAGEVWAHSPFTEDKTASFHLTDQGWYCFATGTGGGALELVQQVRRQREGVTVDCYAAARWLIESGLSRTPGEEPRPREPSPAPPPRARAEKAPNRPIRQDLVPRLSPEHPELDRRGLSPATCAYLGCGYLPAGGRSPLAGQIVFQVRGVRPAADGSRSPVILSHIGRTLEEEAESQDPDWHKWHFYEGFQKTLELYNIDKLVGDARAAEQARTSGHVLLVEGCFDVARLVEAGLFNVGATFGAHLDADQLPRLQEVAGATGVRHFRVWFDRDQAGRAGQEKAIALVNETEGLTATGFDWDVGFPSPTRGSVKIPETLRDPGDFTPEQLAFLRERILI